MSIIIQLSSSGASTFGTAIICIYHIIPFVRLQHTPSPYCRTRTRRRLPRAQRRYFGAASTANAERKLRRYKMPRRPKVPNFLTLPSAAAASPRRRPHVAAVALSAAGTRRRMGAQRLRHHPGTVGVSVCARQHRELQPCHCKHAEIR